MPQSKPLEPHQQELVNIVKAAHQTLAIARKTRASELARRIAAEKIRLDREFEEGQIRIKARLDKELVTHETNLDEALIAAYNNGVPIRRIAFDGFGNRYDGGVQQLLVKLRADGRIGSREGFQRNTRDELDPTVAFPEPIDVHSILAENTRIDAPTFTLNDEPLVLVEPDENGRDGVSVQAVTLKMDPRDPWFSQIAKSARAGTPYRYDTTCTLYLHPATGALLTFESKETGDVTWDHPVARWVKVHPETALAGFNAALADQFGTRAEASE